MFSHQKLHVYQSSIEWFALSNKITKSLPRGNADLANQLKRAATSISLNIAEGAGKIGLADKRRFYAIARGSALECAAILDVITVLKITETSNLSEGKRLLHRIVSMLSKLCLG